MNTILIGLLIFIVVVAVVVAGVSFFRDQGGETALRTGDVSSVGRSDDEAQSWIFNATSRRGDGQRALFRPDIITTLLFSPHEEMRNFVFVGTRKEGLHWSGDAGLTWERIEGANGELGGNVTIYDIAFDPRDPNRWYLAAFLNDLGQVLVTTDNGQTFTSTYHTATSDNAVFSIEVDPFRVNTIYAATSEGLLLQSNDHGNQWEALQVYDTAVSHLVAHPTRSGVMFIVVQGRGLFRSQNRGASFEQVSGGAPRSLRGSAINFVIDPLRPNVMALAAPEGLFHSDDSGSTWERVPIVIPPSALPIRDVVLSPHRAGTLYVAAGFTIYISTNDGIEWKLRPLPGSVQVLHLEADPRIPGRLFVGL